MEMSCCGHLTGRSNRLAHWQTQWSHLRGWEESLEPLVAIGGGKYVNYVCQPLQFMLNPIYKNLQSGNYYHKPRTKSGRCYSGCIERCSCSTVTQSNCDDPVPHTAGAISGTSQGFSELAL